MLSSVAQLYGAGATLRAIGAKVGLTAEGVRQRLMREGVHRPRGACGTCSTHGASRAGDRCCACQAQARAIAWRKGHKKRRVKRFWARVDSSGGDNACWPWQGSRYPAGYGHVSWPGVSGAKGRVDTGAHRVAYSLSNSGIPSGKQVNHVCDNPPCCNPKHLYAGTQVDNICDRDVRGRNGRLGRRKVKCKRGHDLIDPTNLYVQVDKATGRERRQCRACCAERHRTRVGG